MMHAERVTDLSLSELIDILEGRVPSLSCDKCDLLPTWDNIPKGTPIPICLACDEVGVIFMEKGDKNIEKVLAKAMENQRVSPRIFLILSYRINELEPETLELLKIFEQDPRNSRVMIYIREKLEIIKAAMGTC